MGSGASETQGWVTRDGVSRQRGDGSLHARIPPPAPLEGGLLIGGWLEVGSFFQGKDCVFSLNYHQRPAERGLLPCVMGHCTHVFTPLAPLEGGLFDRWVVEGWFLFSRKRLRFPLNHHQCPAQRGLLPCVMGHCTHAFPPLPPSRGDFLIGGWLEVGSFFQGEDCVFPLNYHQRPAERCPPWRGARGVKRPHINAAPPVCA